MSTSEAQDLQRRLLAVIHRGAGAPLPPEDFEQLAADVFRYQYGRNSIYRAFCDARGINPSNLATVDDIPAVPTDAFKAAPLTSGDPDRAAAVFHTSGTTAGNQRRGTHVLLDTALYEASLGASFREHLLPEGPPMRIASFIPPAEEQPDSSLSFMIREVLARFGSDGSGYFVSGSGLDVDGFLATAREALDRDEPVLIVGTSFAFVHLLDELGNRGTRLALPPSSRVMDTGGFKGRAREIGRDELYSLIETHLGISPAFVINEYGMTEMSSQMYDGVAGSAPAAGARRVHTGPPWLRTTVVDPETLSPVGDGQIGILRHLDLANLHSVMALQTADLGRVSARGGIELLGRASGAEPRGCSIAMDDLLRLLRSGR